MRVAIKDAYLLCAGKDGEKSCLVGAKGTVILNDSGAGVSVFFGNSGTDMQFYFEDGSPDDWARVEIPMLAPIFFCPKHKVQAEAAARKEAEQFREVKEKAGGVK